MYIHKVDIFNFRSHEKTSIELEKISVLIGQNNSGKTSFLQALNAALGYKRTELTEDDFYAAGENFDPKTSNPIRVVIEFREKPKERFSDNVNGAFEKAIRFDEKISGSLDEPIRYFKICYDYQYSREKDRYEEDRYFVDENNIRLKIKESSVTRTHLSFFPFFYIESLRDINREIRNKNSFWGKIKSAINFKEKESEINKLLDNINNLLLKDNDTVDRLLKRLEELENNIKIIPNSLSLHAFAKRSWELLDGLNIYIKLPKSNLSLPISKHGAGTQNIVVLLIFSAYLDTMLSKIVDNLEASPIIGLEEPEAHVFPQAQRALFHQAIKMRGQKIISTHSPYIADQADLYSYIVFSLTDGETIIRRIPQFKKSFEYKYNLPEPTYENNKFLNTEEELMMKRYLKFRNTELFFSSLFILCEGDSEKIFIERLLPFYTEKHTGQMGISVISCDGQTYSPFLKIAHSDALCLKWIILSDGELQTKETLKKNIKNSGYDYNVMLAGNYVYFLPEGQDFEKYYTKFYGYKKVEAIINTDAKIMSKFQNFKGQPDKISLTDEMLIEKFLDTSSVKPLMAEILANYIVQTGCEIPHLIQMIFTKVKREVEH